MALKWRRGNPAREICSSIEASMSKRELAEVATYNCISCYNDLCSLQGNISAPKHCQACWLRCLGKNASILYYWSSG